MVPVEDSTRSVTAAPGVLGGRPDRQTARGRDGQGPGGGGEGYGAEIDRRQGIRVRLVPKNFGFWLTVAFRLYLVISV